MAKTKIILMGFIFLAIISSVFFATSSAQAVDFTYKPMEKIPGFENVNIADFPTLIETIYRFALWVVGICALFMITIGGFSYMTSAGNTAKAGSGKAIITDALIGLILVFTAFLIFYVINPNITSVDLKISPAGTTQPGTTPPPSGSQAPTGHDAAEDQRVRALLAQAGITINRPACTAVPPTTCVDGLPENVINGLIKLKETTNCGIQVTGGTEGKLGGHGPNCHNPGQSCADISRNGCLNAYFHGAQALSTLASQYGIKKICVDDEDPDYPQSAMCYNCCGYTESASHFHFSF